MAAKEFLMRARYLQKRIDQLEAVKESAWDCATSMTASYGKGGGTASSLNRKGESYSSLSDEIDRERQRLQSIREETVRVINQIPDNTLAALLMARYVRDLSWDQVAAELSFSYKHVVHDLHLKALHETDLVLERCNRM